MTIQPYRGSKWAENGAHQTHLKDKREMFVQFFLSSFLIILELIQICQWVSFWFAFRKDIKDITLLLFQISMYANANAELFYQMNSEGVVTVDKRAQFSAQISSIGMAVLRIHIH